MGTANLHLWEKSPLRQPVGERRPIDKQRERERAVWEAGCQAGEGRAARAQEYAVEQLILDVSWRFAAKSGNEVY